MKFYVLAALLLTSFLSSAQASVLNKKGKWSVYYGYHSAEYSKSDYHLTGNGYDFTLKDVEAIDTPSQFGVDPYLIPSKVSVPQNNFRFSYFFTDTLSLSFGNDHMKYRMNDYQTVGFEGTIATGGEFDRSGSGTQDINPDFLMFEHTHGLNYVSFEFEHFKALWLSNKGNQAISIYWGPGLGIMYPSTNARLFDKPRNDEFHLAGYGYSVKFGAEYIFYKDWFLRLGVKYGHINMTDAKTSPDASDTLAHEFDFYQTFGVVGFYF